MNLNDIINYLLSLNVWSIAKFFVLVALLIYVTFAFILVRQVSVMTKVLCGQLDFVLKTFSVLLLLLSIGVFLAALFFL